MAHLEKPVGEVHIHNREAEGVAALFPHQLRSTSSTLIELLEDYYTYLNSKDQATNLIDRIQHEHDIDLTDEKYLNEIKKEIAKGVQGSFVLDNRQLFRRIVDYYKTRGTDDSARTFFRLFFDGEASITYPRDYLFKPSSGDMSSFGYIDSDGNRIEYDTTVGSFEQDLPAPSIPVEIDDTQRFGFIRVDGTYETAFWEYDRPSADRKFTIRIEKDELNSPELEEVALNDGQNGLPTFLKHDDNEDIVIDETYVYEDDDSTNDYDFRLGVWDAPNTTIYEKNLDTGAISTWRENLSGEGHSEAATDVKQRHLYYSDNLFHLMRSGRNHVMAPLHAAGKYFANTQERDEDNRVIFHFFALEDTRIEFYELPREIPSEASEASGASLTDVYNEYVAGKDFDLVTEDNGTYGVIVLKEVKEIKAGKFATFIGEADTTDSAEWDRHAFFKSTGNIIGTCNVVNAQSFRYDAHILSPMAQKYAGRGIGGLNATIIYDISKPDKLNIKKGASGLANNIELEDGQFGVVTEIADGVGSDSTQTMPFGSCKDTYVWGDTLRGFNFRTLYPDNTPGVGIRTYGLVDGEWERYTYSNNLTIVYGDRVEGSESGSTSDAILEIGADIPTAWKFESNLPFAVWINDTESDEETLWSTYNRNTYNQSAYTLYEDYNDRKGFISDINKIHDGNYWQEFSYALNTDVSVDLWKDRYYKLVHPSGLKLFSDLFIERFAERKDREEKPLFNVGSPTWVTDLYGAANQFMTHYQPGWLDVTNTAQVVLETLIAAGASAPQIESYLEILSTYEVTTDIDAVNDTVEFELKTTYVYTPTDFVIGDSSNNYYASGTFESVNDIDNPGSTLNQSLKYATWDTSISAIAADTISTLEGLLDITDISNVKIKIGSGPDDFTSDRTLTPDPDNLSIEFPTEDV